MADVVKRVKANGFTEYLKAVEQYKDSTLHLFALFTGSPNKDGQSWCPDCVKADPVIDAALENAPECSCLITVLVGDRLTWKDPNNTFRKSDVLRLKSVPTLIKVGTKKRLEDRQCSDPAMVEMLLEDE